MSDREEEQTKAQKVEEFLHIFKKGADFTNDLLKENERLRFQLLKLTEEVEIGSVEDGDLHSTP